MKTIWILLAAVVLCSCAAPDMRDPVSNMVTVRGEVRKPGDYPLVKGMTARQAIKAAGGYSDYASGIRVVRGAQTILRKRDREWKDHGNTWDIPLQNHDIVIGERMY